MMLGEKLREVVQQAFEESRKQLAEGSPEKLPASPMTERNLAHLLQLHLLFLPVAVFLALLVIGSSVVGQSLTTHGSPANVIAEMLGFVFELVFLIYMVLFSIGFGIARVVEAIKAITTGNFRTTSCEVAVEKLTALGLLQPKSDTAVTAPANSTSASTLRGWIKRLSPVVHGHGSVKTGVT